MWQILRRNPRALYGSLGLHLIVGVLLFVSARFMPPTLDVGYKPRVVQASVVADRVLDAMVAEIQATSTEQLVTPEAPVAEEASARADEEQAQQDAAKQAELDAQRQTQEAAQREEQRQAELAARRQTEQEAARQAAADAQRAVEAKRQAEAAQRAEQHQAELAAQRQAEAQRAAEAKRQAEAAQREEQHQAELAAQRQTEQEAARQAAADAQRAAEAKRQATEAARQRRIAAEAERMAEAEAKQLAADVARQNATQAEQGRQQATESQRAREEDLLSALDSEQLAHETDRYAPAIQDRVSQFWIRPPASARGLMAIVSLRLIPGGEVVPNSVRVIQSSGHAAFDQSAIAAVYQASPLPVPSGSAFEPFREFDLKFNPDKL